MMKKESPLGTTHAAHEARHLAQKMNMVRNGEMSMEQMQAYFEKLNAERDVLITRFKDCWSYVGDRKSRVINYEVPELTVEEAAKRSYMDGYEPEDFDCAKRVQFEYAYSSAKPPQKNHVGVCAMVIQAAINDLTWAIAEVQAHLRELES